MSYDRREFLKTLTLGGIALFTPDWFKLVDETKAASAGIATALFCGRDDAIVRALYRLAVSRRHLLQWTTAAVAQAQAATRLAVALEEGTACDPRVDRVVVGSLGIWGFGLGLSYVKKIVEAHGGSVQVSSKLGVGSTFEITIPNGTNN